FLIPPIVRAFERIQKESKPANCVTLFEVISNESEGSKSRTYTGLPVWIAPSKDGQVDAIQLTAYELRGADGTVSSREDDWVVILLRSNIKSIKIAILNIGEFEQSPKTSPPKGEEEKKIGPPTAAQFD
ncbi:MAG: hypothetical protein AAFR64_10895, partial [Pseudomonadota bacterium]